MIWITVLFLLTYNIALLVILWQGKRYKEVPHGALIAETPTMISVIVPVRNEEKNVYTLLESIFKNFGEYEVLLVNDHSEDDTLAEITRFIEQNPTADVKVLHLDGVTSSPKKSAITLAIKQAKGEIIVTTDGDCVVPENWISTIEHEFKKDDVQMVLGDVRYAPANTLFEKMQAYELAALLTLSLSRAKANKPFTCNGANLAYRKEVFFEVDGFDRIDDIASGDDELLMKKVFSAYPKGIYVQERAVVETLPNHTFDEFIHQRIRWASKWKYGTLQDKLPGAFLMLLYLSFTFIPLGYEYRGWNNHGLVIVYFLLYFKFHIDRRVIAGALYPKKKVHPDVFPSILLFLVYPFYVVFFGLSATFLKFNWKGRRLK